MSTQVHITTIDNPYNPFDDFDKWYDFDTIQKGYYSLQYLARLARTSSELSDEENHQVIENAIDTMIKNDLFNIYRKVTKTDD